MEERKVIKASEGMVLTNGTDFARTIYFAVGVDLSHEWYEIPEEEYQMIMAEREKQNEDHNL
jgi:hypothetical protein